MRSFRPIPLSPIRMSLLKTSSTQENLIFGYAGKVFWASLLFRKTQLKRKTNYWCIHLLITRRYLWSRVAEWGYLLNLNRSLKVCRSFKFVCIRRLIMVYLLFNATIFHEIKRTKSGYLPMIQCRSWTWCDQVLLCCVVIFCARRVVFSAAVKE